MTGSNILLLGGSGFVGRALLEEWARLPAGSVRVRALLRRPDAVPDYGFLDKVVGRLEAPPRHLEPAEPYVLVHFAVKQIDTDGTGYLATNVEATGAWLESLGSQLEGVIYGSSMSVYGQGAQDGIRETATTHPDTPLAQSRRLAELRVEARARRGGIPAFFLRPRFVLGKSDRFVLPYVAKLAGKRVRIASGKQRFSIIDVEDYARVITQLAEQILEKRHAPTIEPLHIGYEQPVSFAQLTGALRETLALPGERWRVPVSPRITRILRRMPLRNAPSIATRLELIGLSHWGDTGALASRIGRDIVGKDPMATVYRAAAYLRDKPVKV